MNLFEFTDVFLGREVLHEGGTLTYHGLLVTRQPKGDTQHSARHEWVRRMENGHGDVGACDMGTCRLCGQQGAMHNDRIQQGSMLESR